MKNISGYEIKKLYDRTEYYYNGKLHRDDDLPAIEYNNGDKYWCINGKLHRLDAPACEYANGTKGWYQNGKSHRLDGPALEHTNGSKHWWIEGKQYTEEEFNKKVKELSKYEIRKCFYKIEYRYKGKLHRDNDLPAIEYTSGTKFWYQNGELHRDNGPAVEYINGAKYWFINNKRHRLDGPAFETPNGTKKWFVNDKQYTEKEFNKILSFGKDENIKLKQEIAEKDELIISYQKIIKNLLNEK